MPELVHEDHEPEDPEDDGGHAAEVARVRDQEPVQPRVPRVLLQVDRRGDPEAIRSRMGPAAWESALCSCERAAGLFPKSLYAGVDLVIASGFRSHAVLEINAFGDLLPGVTDRGMDPYTAELAALIGPASGEAA